MQAEIILKLLEAGYTKSDIDLMEEMEPKQAAQPEPDQDQPEPEKAAQPDENGQESAPAKTDGTAEMLKTLTDTVAALKKTVEAMQENNVKTAETEAPKRFSTVEALQDFFGEKKKA